MNNQPLARRWLSIAATVAPLLDEQGNVSSAVQQADVVVSGGQRLTADLIGQMSACRLLLRPYVGYDDIDG